MSEENQDEGFRDPTAPTWDQPEDASGFSAVGQQDVAEQARPPVPDVSQTQVIGEPGTAQLPVTPPAVQAPLDPPTANPYARPQHYGSAPPPYGSAPQQPYPGPPPPPYSPAPPGVQGGPHPGAPVAYGQPPYGQPPYGQPGGVQNPYARNPDAQGQAPTFRQPSGSGSNTSAIVLLVLSSLMTLTCLLTQIPALIMAIVALSKFANDPEGSRRLTRYGWIAFGVGLAVALIVVIGIIALFATTSSSVDGYSF